MAASTSSVYVSVIEDVVSKVRDEFIKNGPGEDVLKELQGIWETRMMDAGAINAPIERSSAAKPTPGSGVTPPVHDLNVPYEGTEEYETPTAELLFPPTPMQTPMPQTPIQTPLPGTADNSYNIPTGGSDYSANESGTSNGGGSTETKAGKPSPYMQPPSPWMSSRPPLDVNIAYVEGRDEVDRGASHQTPTQDFFQVGKRKREDLPSRYPAGGFIPQQDGAGDAAPQSFEFEISGGSTSIGGRAHSEILTRALRSTPKIPQLDGPIPDPYDDALSTPNIYNYQGSYNEDYNVASTPAPNDLPVSTPAPVVQNDLGDEEDDEPPLNENDDDDLDDVDSGEDVNPHGPLVLAQFDKVTRTKSRWKCTLKDGIMRINDKDILFNKATGEFDF